MDDETFQSLDELHIQKTRLWGCVSILVDLEQSCVLINENAASKATERAMILLVTT